MKRTIVMLAVAAASTLFALAQPPSSASKANSSPVPKTTTTSRSGSGAVQNRTRSNESSTPTGAAGAVYLASTVPMVTRTTSAQIPATRVSTPLMYLTKPLVKRPIEHVGGMSSRPWAQIVGIHPGYSAFPRPEMHESSLYLFWVGHDPR